jgi:hypothetical protein
MKQVTLTFSLPVLDWDRLALLVRAELIPQGIIPTDQDVMAYLARATEAVINDLLDQADKVRERDRLIAAGDIEIGRPASRLRLVP